MPLFGLGRMWLWGLLTVALWVGVGVLFSKWSEALPDPRPPVQQTDPSDPPPPPRPPASFEERFSAWRPGFDGVTALFASAVALTLLGVGGGRALVWLLLPKRGIDPINGRTGETITVTRPDGTELCVELSGRADAPLVVLTHGWGTSAAAWGNLRRALDDRYRVAAYDLRGLGRSVGPRDRQFALDRMAEDLRAVIDACGGGPAVLVGHSIGGMIQLTLAKTHPEDLGTRVGGIVITNSTPTDPTHTTQLGEFMAAIKGPVLIPMGWLMIALAPLVWVMNVMSYLNGSAHWSNYDVAFSWTGTWQQVDFISRYTLEIWPGAYARGAMAMFDYHAADILHTITVPTLVVVGDLDKMTVPGAGEAIRAGVPGAEKATLAPAGHMGPIQRPDDFATAVRGFLDRHHPGRRAAAAPMAHAVG